MFKDSNLNGERKYGLSRTRQLLKLCGNPDKKLKIVHIAGTNGKGSCAAFIAHVLKAAGIKAGAFTSPQVYSFEEQFCIDCLPISAAKAQKYIGEISRLAKLVEDSPTPFEIYTAAALFAFCSEGCTHAVVECGLGGKDDATNAISGKELAVITSISLEHTRELGSTIESICEAKSGIVKNCPLIVSALQSNEGLNYFKKLGAAFAGEGLVCGDGAFVYGGESYKIQLAGREQCYNAATAIEACRALGIGGKAIKEGIRQTTLPARCQILNSGGTTFILDGAHNPSAFSPLLQLADKFNGKKCLVFGCLADKDVCAIADVLCRHFDFAVLVSPDNPRGMALDKIKGAFGGKINCVEAQSVQDALSAAKADLVAVCGSFSILEEAKHWIEREQ